MKTTIPEQASLHTEPEFKANLAKFLLHLIQSFLRTGYYTPDHPEAKNSKLGLYEDFQKLFTKKGELTFLVRNDHEGKEIQIEGIMPEAQSLDSLMLRGMAEMYTPKFTKFIEQKDLISLTLKSTMSRTEFTNFVDIMGEPLFVDTHEKKDKERFSQILKEKGIVNISYIFSEEFLAIKRKIPYRTQIALTRLKKDFNMIPFFYDLDEEGLKKIRRQTIQDIARPIQTPDAIYPVLMNSDLAQTKELKESEINEAIITFLSDEVLLNTSKTLLKEALRNRGAEPHQGKAIELASQFALSLNERKIEGGESILEEYIRHKLVPLEQLPQAMQRKYKFDQSVKRFLKNSDSFLDKFDKIEDGERYLQMARSLTKVIPELIHRDRYKEVQEIITRIGRHFGEEKDVSLYAEQILDEIEGGETLQLLKEKFLTGKEEICQAIAPIFAKLHAGSVPYLLSLLKQSGSSLVRRHAGEILAQIDPSAVNRILDELGQEGVANKSSIDILHVLAGIECEEWVEPLVSIVGTYLKNKNPSIRGEALAVYYKIMGGGGEALYMDSLEDANVGVQKKAIQYLGEIKSATALEKLLEMRKQAEDSPSDRNSQIEASLFRTLGFYGNIELPGIGLLEDFLLDILDRRLNLGALKFIKKKKNPLSDGAVGVICETLGEIGTDKSSEILQKLEKQEDKEWNSKAKEALIMIVEREEGKSLIEAP
jgi:HEAT repeat protein